MHSSDNMGRDRGPSRNKSLFVRNIADDIDQGNFNIEDAVINAV
jgi:hypothetical protein